MYQNNNIIKEFDKYLGNRNRKIIIVGLGGIGFNVGKILIQEGMGKYLTIIDNDMIDDSTRYKYPMQPYLPYPKVYALANLSKYYASKIPSDNVIFGRYPNPSITIYPHSIVIDCMDNTTYSKDLYNDAREVRARYYKANFDGNSITLNKRPPNGHNTGYNIGSSFILSELSAIAVLEFIACDLHEVKDNKFWTPSRAHLEINPIDFLSIIRGETEKRDKIVDYITTTRMKASIISNKIRKQEFELEFLLPNGKKKKIEFYYGSPILGFLLFADRYKQISRELLIKIFASILTNKYISYEHIHIYNILPLFSHLCEKLPTYLLDDKKELFELYITLNLLRLINYERYQELSMLISSSNDIIQNLIEITSINLNFSADIDYFDNHSEIIATVESDKTPVIFLNKLIVLNYKNKFLFKLIKNSKNLALIYTGHHGSEYVDTYPILRIFFHKMLGGSNG